MKVYKIELLVIDFDNIGEDGIINEIENVEHTNGCISTRVRRLTGKDIGEWNDDNPLNFHDTWGIAYDELFIKE